MSIKLIPDFFIILFVVVNLYFIIRNKQPQDKAEKLITRIISLLLILSVLINRLFLS